MKTPISTLVIIAGLFSILALLSSCEKPDHSADLPKEQQVIGQWYIFRLQLNVYSGGVLVKDSIVPLQPVNFVKFDEGGGFAHQLNTPTPNSGTYQFVGLDSIISVTPAKTYRWKFLTLVKNLMTVRTTTTNHPSFPGATVITYQSFGRK